MKAYRLTAPTSCPFNNGYINPFPFLQRFYENTQTVGVGGSSAAFRGARNQTRCIFLVLLRLCGESKLRERQAHPAGLRIIPFLILFFFSSLASKSLAAHKTFSTAPSRHRRRRRRSDTRPHHPCIGSPRKRAHNNVRPWSGKNKSGLRKRARFGLVQPVSPGLHSGADNGRPPSARVLPERRPIVTRGDYYYPTAPSPLPLSRCYDAVIAPSRRRTNAARNADR